MITTKTTLPGRVSAEGENAPDQWVRVGLYLVIVAAIVVSGDTLIFLASQAGWTGWRAWLLPLLIDLPGFLGGRIWLRRKPTNPTTRAYARRLTLAALGASLAGNVTGHLVHAGHLPAGLALVIVAAMVAPIVLAAVLHLDALLTPTSRKTTTGRSQTDQPPAEPGNAALTARPDRAAADRPAVEAAPLPRPAKAKPTGTASRSERRPPKKADPRKDQAYALWQAARDEGRQVSGAEVGRAVGADDSTGRGWVREFKSGPTRPAPQT